MKFQKKNIHIPGSSFLVCVKMCVCTLNSPKGKNLPNTVEMLTYVEDPGKVELPSGKLT